MQSPQLPLARAGALCAAPASLAACQRVATAPPQPARQHTMAGRPKRSSHMVHCDCVCLACIALLHQRTGTCLCGFVGALQRRSH